MKTLDEAANEVVIKEPTAASIPDKAEPLPGTFWTDVVRCARCGGGHRHVLFRAFRGTPPSGFNFYGTCPRFGEPILMIRTE
jgi:hypothetical protein